MSIIRSAREFFGLTPMDEIADDEYYADEPRETERERYSAHREPAASYEPRRYDYLRRASVVPVVLTSYRQASRVGEPFRDGDAVVFDISGMEQKEATRIVDFAAGICFALEGKMVKIAPRVFAVTPKGADIEQSELERAARVR